MNYEDIALMRSCDEAAEKGFLKCEWCDAHGHRWRECSEYEVYVIAVGERSKAVFRTSWQMGLLLLGFGFAAGMAFKALLERM